MKFSFEVVESRAITCTYVVEAETIEEARRKAETGDTVSESYDESSVEVFEREIID